MRCLRVHEAGITNTHGLTSPGALGWIVMAISGALMKDHLTWMSSLFSFMWSSSY